MNIDKRLAQLDERLKTLLHDLKISRRAFEMDQIKKLVTEIAEGTK